LRSATMPPNRRSDTNHCITSNPSEVNCGIDQLCSHPASRTRPWTPVAPRNQGSGSNRPISANPGACHIRGPFSKSAGCFRQILPAAACLNFPVRSSYSSHCLSRQTTLLKYCSVQATAACHSQNFGFQL